MQIELKKRIITSFFLFFLLIFMYIYSYIMIISLIIIITISWIEFYSLFSKIFSNKDLKNKFFKFLFKALSLIYLSTLLYFILNIESQNMHLKIYLFYSILVSIASDIGGLIIGKIFKGRKLTKISPKKTISGAIGSFIFSLILVPLFIKSMPDYEIITLLFITIFISLISQIGDLFISLLKRKAKVKDTSDLLPGHGGVLDRIDGMIFAIPAGLLLFNFMQK